MVVMIDFAELARIAPEVSEPIAARVAATGLGMLGTIRANGAPRVSPIEVGPFEDRLYVGMMPRSQKHLDAVRDPRYCLVTAIANREDLDGEGKLFGVLDPVTDAARAETILRHHAAGADFDPEALVGSPMFELLIDMAAWQQVVDDAWTTLSWREGVDGVQRRSRTS
jgi:hypothetical protein